MQIISHSLISYAMRCIPSNSSENYPTVWALIRRQYSRGPKKQ